MADTLGVPDEPSEVRFILDAIIQSSVSRVFMARNQPFRISFPFPG